MLTKKTARKMAPNRKLPELLSPAGSPEAVRAAVQAGADAVYFGGKTGNARVHARNFTDEEIVGAINILHEYGRRAYITLNTLHTDRELKDMIKFAELCCINGADAFILQDLGLAGIIKYYFPDISLHASTQAAGHNTDAFRVFKELGFSRAVAARELDAANLKLLVDNSPVETEIFIHGALCSSHSGRCFMSFALGNTRSANRGSCAQPCRLEYERGHILSLKDQCLAAHLEQIIEIAPASLKIEGRMKRPEYVYHTAKIYRTCLDERRNAADSEIETLAKIFSRQGFTDGYFTRSLGKRMYGVRTEENKSETAGFKNIIYAESATGKKAEARASRVSQAVFPRETIKNINMNPKLSLIFNSRGQFLKVADYLKTSGVLKRIYRIFMPLDGLNVPEDFAGLTDKTGIRLPYVIFDDEKERIYQELVLAKNKGVKYALVDNIGHIDIASGAGLELSGNAGLNITNSQALEEYKNLGFKDALLSPELKFAQIRDISKSINAGIIAYGRINLMISENKLPDYIKDKTGAVFPAFEDNGRSVLYNSVPVYLADKRGLYKNSGLFFIGLNFTVEPPEEIIKIINGYVSPEKAELPGKFTRGYK